MRPALVLVSAASLMVACSSAPRDELAADPGARSQDERTTEAHGEGDWYAPRPLDGCQRGCDVVVKHLVAGGAFTCALVDGGSVRCWGDDSAGQLGRSSRLGPVPGLANVVALTAGMLHACALTARGAVHCWGSNGKGQLGDLDGPPTSDVPLEVRGLPRPVQSLVSGVQSTCAVHDDGSVTCWGRLHAFQGGSPPTKLDLGGKRARTVRPTSQGVMVVYEDGTAQIARAFGEYPAIAFAGRKIVDVAQGVTAAGMGMVARLDDGSLRIWSMAPTYANCLHPTTNVTLLPQPSREECERQGNRAIFWCGLPVPSHVCPQGGADCATIRDIAWYPKSDPFGDVRGVVMNEGWIGTGAENLGGYAFGCMLSAAGRVRCFGLDADGQLGTGTTGLVGNATCTEPRVNDPKFLTSEIAEVVVGGAHACALDRAGRVTCWGKNDRSSTSPTLGSWTQATGAIPAEPVVFR